MNDENDFAELERDATNYPKTLRITVASPEDAFDRAIEQVSEGVAEEAVRSFESVADIRRLLTDRRLELVRAIMTEPPASISDLADRLGRNYADVHADVQVLAEHHVVYFETDGRAKRPVVPYERVRIDIEIVGGPEREPTPA